MVLEEHIVLVSRSADAPEDIALHEVVDVRAKTVDDLIAKSVCVTFVNKK